MTSSQPGATVPPIVLLVEDELDIAEMYESHLSGAGYWVASARSEADACVSSIIEEAAGTRLDRLP
jgi:DNA-binding response OmpR family regulator